MPNISKFVLKKWMNLFSQIGKSSESPWKGYTLARNASTETERQNALLQISKARYEESKMYPLCKYFKTDLRKILKGKDIFEVGSNHGGATFAYFELYQPKSIIGLDTSKSQVDTSKIFFKSKGVSSNFDFVVGHAEYLPFPSNFFDLCGY